MALFTLRNATTDASRLYGKIIKIEKDDESNCLRFYDAITNKFIWETTTVIEEVKTADGIIFKTRIGVKYDFVDMTIPEEDSHDKFSSTLNKVLKSFEEQCEEKLFEEKFASEILGVVKKYYPNINEDDLKDLEMMIPFIKKSLDRTQR